VPEKVSFQIQKPGQGSHSCQTVNKEKGDPRVVEFLSMSIAILENSPLIVVA